MAFQWASSRRALWLCLSTCALAGCEGGGFLPPPALPAKSTPSEATAVPARAVALVLDHNDRSDYRYLTRQARMRAADHKVMLDESSLAPGDSPARQADLIRAAIAHHPSALVVRPVDAPEVTAALQEAQAQGVPLVLLDRAVGHLSDSSPVTLVTYAPYAESAAALVAASKAAAQREGLPDGGTAILLVNTLADPRTQDRVDALRRAMIDAGIAQCETQKFAGKGQSAETNFVAALAADPHVTMVFADEYHGLSCALYIARDQLQKRRFTVAGYTNFDVTPELVLEETNTADGNALEFMNRAVDTAVSLSRGEKAPARIEIPHPLRTAIRTPTPL